MDQANETQPNVTPAAEPQAVELRTLAPVLPGAQSVLTRLFPEAARVVAIEAEPGVEIVGLRVGRRAVERLEGETWSEALRRDRGVPARTYLSLLIRSGVSDKRVLMGRAFVVLDPSIPAAAPPPPSSEVRGEASVEAAPPVVAAEIVGGPVPIAEPSGTREVPRTITGTLGGPRTGGYGGAGASQPSAPAVQIGPDVIGTRKEPRHVQGTTARRNVDVHRVIKSGGGAARTITTHHRREGWSSVQTMQRVPGEGAGSATIPAAPPPAVPTSPVAIAIPAPPAIDPDAPADMLALVGLTPEAAREAAASVPTPSIDHDPALRHLRPGDMHARLPNAGERMLALDKGVARNLLDALERRGVVRSLFKGTLVRCLEIAKRSEGARSWAKSEAPIVLRDEDVAVLQRFVQIGGQPPPAAARMAAALREGLAHATVEDVPARAGEVVNVEARAS